MYVGNVMLLILNLPLIGLLVRVLEIQRAWLSPVILLLCLIGVYSSVGDASGVAMCIAFGFVGYFLRCRGYDLGIVILAFVLGPIIERSVRQALTISDGNPAIFVQSPLAVGFAVLAATILLVGLWPKRPVLVPA
jgi:putative tricarboxylic transport membrane protein